MCSRRDWGSEVIAWPHPVSSLLRTLLLSGEATTFVMDALLSPFCLSTIVSFKVLSGRT